MNYIKKMKKYIFKYGNSYNDNEKSDLYLKKILYYKKMIISGGSKSRPSPSESATLFKIGTKKQGNDGNIWIVIGTSTGVKRWKKINDNNKYIQVNDSEQCIDTNKKDIIDLTTFKNFKFFRNNSEIVGKIKCYIDLDENLMYIKLKSKYVPEADNENICIKLDKCHIKGYHTGVYKISFKRKNVNKDNEIYYTLYFHNIEKKHKNIFDKIIYKNGESIADFSQYMLPYITEHHFGEMVLLTNEIRKKLKPNTKYYIMTGPPEISHCYDGNGCLYVMDLDDNKIYDIGNKNEYEDAGGIDEYNNTGDCWPIYIITKFRDGFKIPKYGLKAETFKFMSY